MRLIDADALIQKVKEEEDERHLDKDDASSLQFLIDEYAESLDAIPVIRCKDCKHYYEREWYVGGGSYTTCWYQTIANAQPNDFCSRAEREEE